MPLPVFSEFVNRGNYWYHRPTGSTANPVAAFAPTPTCVIIDEDIISLNYTRGREGLSANYSDNCVRKSEVTYSATGSVLASSLGLPIISNPSIEDIINLVEMQQIGANSYRHCSTGSTLTYSVGCDFTVEQSPCEPTNPCQRVPIGIIGVSIQRVTAYQTPAGNCIKVPVESISMSMRVRKETFASGGTSMNDIRGTMVATASAAVGTNHAAIVNMLHDTSVWSLYNELMTGVISTCS